MNGKIDYLWLVNSIEAELILMKDAVARFDRCVFALRHDVDSKFNVALELAEYEHTHNLKSTYFLLHTASYFNYSSRFIGRCKKLVGWGHDIGLHNDATTVWFKFKKKIPMKTIIEKPLNFLRKNGIEVVGASSHGLRKKLRPFNYEVWKEFDARIMMKKQGAVKIPKVSLMAVGLNYEAYFLDYDAYFSDSGCHPKTIGLMVDKTKPKLFEREALHSKQNIGLKIIGEFNKLDRGFLQVLAHPGCWKKK